MATPEASLRQLLGERIPAGGDESDTLFSEQEILDFLSDAANDVNLAAYKGWLVKAAELSNLVTKAEGNATEQMSDLHKQAMKQVEMFAAIAGVYQGKTRIGQITRPNRSGIRQPLS